MTEADTKTFWSPSIKGISDEHFQIPVQKLQELPSKAVSLALPEAFKDMLLLPTRRMLNKLKIDSSSRCTGVLRSQGRPLPPQLERQAENRNLPEQKPRGRNLHVNQGQENPNSS